MIRRAPFLPMALLLLAGCVVGPDFVRPDAPAATGYAPTPPPTTTVSTEAPAGDAQRFAPDAALRPDWWRIFFSSELDAILQAALAANADLDAARAALRRAEALADAGRGGLFPSAGLTGQASRQRAEPVAGVRSPAYSLSTGRVEVSYAADLFGGTRREIEALEAEADQQRFELGAATLTLTGNLVQAVLRDAALKMEIEATRRIIASAESTVELLRRRFALGAVSRNDVLLQEAALMQRRVELPGLLRQAEQQRTLIAVLSGRTTDRPGPPTPRLDALRLPATLPLRLPSDLVRQRPDILVAEARLRAANAQIGVATAEMLPRLILTASYGRAQSGGIDAFTPQGIIWSLAAGLTQPLFQGGRLVHRRQAAIAARDQASAQYRGTVLRAFKDVADALRAIELDAEALRIQQEAAVLAARSLAIAREQLRIGAVTSLEVLAAQQADAQAQIGLVRAQEARFADTVALLLALGSGWGEAPEVAALR